MARKQKRNLFTEIDPNHEAEVYETYAYLAESDSDVTLRHLPAIFRLLRIPTCFTSDILKCIAYYYDMMHMRDVVYNGANPKQAVTLRLLHAYTLTASNADTSGILDILDIDKLTRNGCRLLKYRDNYTHIAATWRLCLEAVSAEFGQYSGSELEAQKIDLPRLKAIKSHLDLDASDSTRGMSDSLLIDMLGCCAVTERDDLINYDMDPQVSYINIKVFAEILGHLGELV